MSPFLIAGACGVAVAAAMASIWSTEHSSMFLIAAVSVAAVVFIGWYCNPFSPALPTIPVDSAPGAPALATRVRSVLHEQLAPLHTAAATLRSPITSFLAWRADYNALLSKARSMEPGAGGDKPRHSARTSVLTAWSDFISLLRDDAALRLLREATASMPLALMLTVLALSTCSSAAIIHRATLMARMYDALMVADQVGTPWSRVSGDLVLYILLYLADDIIDMAMTVATDSMRSTLEFKARTRFFTSVLTRDATRLEDARFTPVDAQRHMADAPYAILDTCLAPARVCRNAFTLVASVYAMLATDVTLSVASTLLRLPVTMNIVAYTASITSLHWRLAEELQSRSSTYVAEVLSHVRFVQAHAAEHVETGVYAGLMREGSSQAATLRVVEKFLARLQALATMLYDTGSLVVAVARVSAGALTVGKYTAFRQYQSSAHSALESLLHEMTRLRSAARRTERFFEVCEDTSGSVIAASAGGIGFDPHTAIMSAAHNVAEASRSPSASVTAAPPRLHGKIQFRNVRFKYPATHGNSAGSAYAVDGVSFVIPAGSSAAFVGTSGSGKTTLFRLLMRFYDLTGDDDGRLGEILVDDVPLKAYDVRYLRRCIGYVEQDPTLLNRSIADNIAYGWAPEDASRPSQAQIEAAAQRARAHDFIMALPDGYATRVGARGVILSGGQRQRISLARAFVRNPVILLLDEGTSSLDGETESAVKAGIDELMRDRTVLLIAHRMKTVEAAQVIHVLRDGGIVQSGSHATMSRVPGPYADLLAHQRVAEPAVSS